MADQERSFKLTITTAQGNTFTTSYYALSLESAVNRAYRDYPGSTVGTHKGVALRILGKLAGGGR